MGTDCNKEWSRRYITNVCGQTFVTKAYKQHREQILYDKERALLPATQPYVERLALLDNLRMEVKEIDAERKRLARKKDELLETIQGLVDSRDAPVERVVFTKACPSPTCRGFLNTHWKCGLCQVKVCSDCHEIKDAEHACNPDSVATAKLLNADTKPCPECHTSIHKIDGCDQMWCTICHTAFSWKSGRKETVIHNPHYYEFMRKQSATGEIPRNPGECVTHLNHHTYGRIRHNSILAVKYENYDRDMNKIGEIIRCILHITHNELTGRYRNIDYVAANQDLRVSFMRGLMTEEAFKIRLQRSEKSNQKLQEIREIFLMIQITATDIISRFMGNIVRDVKMADILPSTLQEISAIAIYANEQFAEIAKTYKTTTISLTSDLKINEKIAKKSA